MPTTEKEIEKIKQYLASERYKKNRDILRAISGPVRFKIICSLIHIKHGLTVSEMGKLFGYSVSRVSHQLRIMRRYRIVTTRRDGKSMVYELSTNPFLRRELDTWRNNAHKIA